MIVGCIKPHIEGRRNFNHDVGCSLLFIVDCCWLLLIVVGCCWLLFVVGIDVGRCLLLLVLTLAVVAYCLFLIVAFVDWYWLLFVNGCCLLVLIVGCIKHTLQAIQDHQQ